MMDTAKKKRLTAQKKHLEAQGWQFGTVAEFLGLTPSQSAVIEIKIALSDRIKSRRQELGLTQRQLATRLKTQQPAIARLELGAGRTVTIDILTHTLLDMGVTSHEIGRILAKAGKIKEPAKATAYHTLSVSVVSMQTTLAGEQEREEPGDERELIA